MKRHVSDNLIPDKCRHSSKGFTIMELLVVVAIIAVLTAIAIPLGRSALEKSQEQDDKASIRAAVEDGLYEAMFSDKDVEKIVVATQKQNGWSELSDTADPGGPIVGFIDSNIELWPYWGSSGERGDSSFWKITCYADGGFSITIGDKTSKTK